MNRTRLVVAVATFMLLLVCMALVVDRLMMPGTFAIQEIRLNGNLSHVNELEMRRHIAQHVDGNFFSVDLDHVDQVARELPWVADVRIRRIWPATIEVAIDEAQPVASWNSNQWLDIGGRIVKVGNDDATRHLPKLSGPDGSQEKVLERFNNLRVITGGFLSVEKLHLGARGSWKMTVSVNGADESSVFEIDAGRDDINQRMVRFVATLQQYLESNLAAIGYVDLRYPGGFSVRWRQGLESQQSVSGASGKSDGTRRES